MKVTNKKARFAFGGGTGRVGQDGLYPCLTLIIHKAALNVNKGGGHDTRN